MGFPFLTKPNEAPPIKEAPAIKEAPPGGEAPEICPFDEEPQSPPQTSPARFWLLSTG